MKCVKIRVAQIYYTHGLFCASHPIPILFIVCSTILLLCYPLVNLPLPGNKPLEHPSPIKEFLTSNSDPILSNIPKEEPEGENKYTPRWLKGPAVAFIQQVVVKATVSPWDPGKMVSMDALQVPLSKMFEIMEQMTSFRYHNRSGSYGLTDLCLRVMEKVKNKHLDLLPQYSCLTLSPANLWHGNKQKFLQDKEILKTVHKRYSQALEVPPTVKDFLFGVPWKETGISRYFIRNKQRTITFAITYVLKAYDQSFFNALKKKLENLYPETGKNVNNSHIDFVVNIHYKESNVFVEYTPLFVTYLVLLLYVYFSVRKIEMVKSKWGLALSAVVTIVASLLISVSMCSLFGLVPTLIWGEIFPYLVVLIGLENILILTKSVVSTPLHLDVRERIAHGLSKEGWSITKNLGTELIIIIFGFFTFVPEIQEFAVFALVGLLSDFFLQMVFFVTVLSVDIRRMELSDLHRKNIQNAVQTTKFDPIEPLIHCPIKTLFMASSGQSEERRGGNSTTAPRLNLSSGMGLMTSARPTQSPRIQHADMFFQNPRLLEIPRRLRLLYFWASTRVFQRIIMVCTVLWISLIIYKTGLVDHFTNSTMYTSNETATSGEIPPQEQLHHHQVMEESLRHNGRFSEDFQRYFYRDMDDVEPASALEHTDLQLWKRLSYKHWPVLFDYYNISIYGRYITILPSIHLSVVIPPDEATSQQKSVASLDTSKDDSVTRINVPASSVKVEAAEDITMETENDLQQQLYDLYDPKKLQQFYPKSQKEFVITLILGVLSVICITYFMLVLYRCMCSRRYDKWRASWNKPKRRSKVNNYIKQIKESVPLVLKGHEQDIECIAVYGNMIVSCCLGGQLRIWDSATGECLKCINRVGVMPSPKRNSVRNNSSEESEFDFYGNRNHDHDPDSGVLFGCHDKNPRPRHRIISKSNRFDFEPDLRSTIETDFSSLPRNMDNSHQIMNSSTDSNTGPRTFSNSSASNVPSVETTNGGYDFIGRFSGVYEEHHRFMAETLALERQQQVLMDCRSRSWSAGDLSSTLQELSLLDQDSKVKSDTIWCLTCRQNLVVAGCGDGRIEFWDVSSGILKCVYAENGSGVTAINFVSDRVIAARLDGNVEFLQLQTSRNPSLSNTLSVSSHHRPVRGHARHLSHSSNMSDDLKLCTESLHCVTLKSTHAHQQPVTVLQTEGGRTVSGSQDHSLKVFRLEDCLCLYTLHGHTGSVTTLYLDKCPPYAAVSGSSDGTIRLWDLLTGSCVHKVKGHEGTIVTMTCTEAYIISSGLDDRLCVWERSRGHLLYTVDMDTSSGSSMAMLSNNFLVTGGEGCLYLWDVSKGELVRVVTLADQERIAFIHHILAMENSTIVCDFGNEIKVIHFPLVLEKAE
ncbi:hypothetical protein ACJMK2_023182 [Sinanodonta woodiana]|uniref:Sterol regulatory element-binding protein cleavage-activating protein n=1 Tax=Sinanodonta woodiana TaxID=1069815 RepID=A0ABD3T489_SINWO